MGVGRPQGPVEIHHLQVAGPRIAWPEVARGAEDPGDQEDPGAQPILRGELHQVAGLGSRRGEAGGEGDGGGHASRIPQSGGRLHRKMGFLRGGEREDSGVQGRGGSEPRCLA
jgi:hypothetical protein